MKSTTLTSLFILASTLGLQAQTPPDLVSSFDAAAEDWRASTNTATLTWQATHGNPDGYLRGTGPSSGWYSVSPAEWAGEWSGYQVLKFDLAVPSGHFHGEFNAGDDVTWFDNITVATGPHTPVVHTTSLVSRFGSGSEGWVG